MGKYFDMLMEDVRMKEGLTACMNCGICTGVCPAAEFYDYDPRQIVNTVQTKDDDAIEQLLKSETIWYCGECMSCRPRCPRANTPGYIIQALRRLSQKLGFFTYSEKGRQQLAIKRTIGHNILKTGYCIKPNLVVVVPSSLRISWGIKAMGIATAAVMPIVHLMERFQSTWTLSRLLTVAKDIIRVSM